MNKRLLIALFLFLSLSTYNLQSNFSFASKFNIRKIIVENNKLVDDKKIKQNLSFLYDSNIFILKTDNINNTLSKIELIQSIEIKKIYPDKIKIKVFEKTPIAIIQNKDKKKYFTKSGDLVNFNNLELFKDLPYVFGNKESFEIFYNDLKKINFPIKDIKKFYLFEANRWDLITNKGQTIKLPVENYFFSLKNFLNIKDKVNFEKYKIFDYRIKDQLILK